MPTLNYKRTTIPDFDALVAQSLDLKSPFRSTVPFLAYWSNPDGRLAEFAQTIGLDIPRDAALTFEYTVSPTRGRGKASHTDLMIKSAASAVGVEAKYTERDYELVSNWLRSANRRLVLGSWLDMINQAIGCGLTIERVKGITYQLVHRTASVCSIAAARWAVVYHCFDLAEGHCYQDQLRELAALVAAPQELKFLLLTTTIAKSPAYEQMQLDWNAKLGRDFSVPIRRLLLARNLAAFGQPVVTAF